MNRFRAIILFIIIALLTLFWAYQLAQTRFDYDFERFFPKADDETEFYEDFRSNFENDYDFLFIGIVNKSGVFNAQFLQRVDSLANALDTLQNVTSITSPTQLKWPIIQPIGLSYKPVLSIKNQTRLAKDSIQIFETRELVGSFFSEQSPAICLVLQTKEKMAKKPSDMLLNQIEQTVSQFKFDEIHLAGKIRAQKVYLDRMQAETFLFLSISVVLVILVLGFIYRSIIVTLVPLGVVFLSIVWQLGFMHLTGKPIDILSILLPTILFVVGTSNVIHIMAKFGEAYQANPNIQQAIKSTLSDVGIPTFLTSFTTAIGFFSLATSIIAPIQEFGLYTGIGVLIAFILSIVLMPALFLFIQPKPTSENKHTQSLAKLFIWTMRHPKLIYVISGSVFLVGIVLATQLKVNNLLLEDLRPHEPLKQDFNFFETQFSGGRPVELVVTPKNGQSIWQHNVLEDVAKVEMLIEKHFKAGFIQSPVTVVKLFNRALNNGLNPYYKIPSDSALIDLIKTMRITGFMQKNEVQKLISPDEKRLRISAKMHDVGSYYAQHMEHNFYAELPQHIDTNAYQFRMTGSAKLIDKNIGYLSLNLVKGLSIAFLIIAALFGLLFKSARMVVIALIPNIIPLICIAAIMAIFTIDLKFSTSIIFTIAFGIAVDDTIHFLSRFRIERRKGKSKLYALKRSYLSTGKAMILTTIVLCVGFVALIFSSFLSIFYVGVLITLTLIIALIADLFLLPILILKFTK